MTDLCFLLPWVDKLTLNRDLGENNKEKEHKRKWKKSFIKYQIFVQLI